MQKTTSRMTRRPIDQHTHDLLVRLSSKLTQVDAYDRFDLEASGPADGGLARTQDARHAELLLSALRRHLRSTPARPVGGRPRVPDE